MVYTRIDADDATNPSPILYKYTQNRSVKPITTTVTVWNQPNNWLARFFLVVIVPRYLLLLLLLRDSLNQPQVLHLPRDETQQGRGETIYCSGEPRNDMVVNMLHWPPPSPTTEMASCNVRRQNYADTHTSNQCVNFL